MEKVATLALSFPLLLSLSAADPTPATSICILTGPDIQNASGGPVITDLGTGLPGDSGLGCNPCTVKGFYVSVAWQQDGFGTIQGLGMVSAERRDRGETGFYAQGKDHPLDCGSEAVLEVEQGGYSSYAVWTCSTCFYD